MPLVKRGNAEQSNPVQERLLTLAALIAPPGEKANLAYLERRAQLKTGTLKDSGRRASISKAVASALLRAAPRIGIAGLTTDWLVLGRGDGPYKSGELPAGVRESRIAYNSDAGGADDDAAYLAYTLETLRALGIAERDEATIGVKLLMLEQAEEIGIEKFGERPKTFIARLRERIRRGAPLGPDGTE